MYSILIKIANLIETSKVSKEDLDDLIMSDLLKRLQKGGDLRATRIGAMKMGKRIIQRTSMIPLHDQVYSIFTLMVPKPGLITIWIPK